MPGTKKARAVEFEGTEHTEESLNNMTTSAVCQLVMRMRGESKPPKPATKAKAIDLVWRAAESLPKAPEPIPEAKRKPERQTIPPEATAETQGAEKQASAKPRKAKMYSIAEGAAVEGLLPQARELANAMRAAGKPLTMAEVAALLQVRKTSKRPDRVCAWYFAKVFRPLGLLIEARG
jgi:hypothetical protein